LDALTELISADAKVIRGNGTFPYLKMALRKRLVHPPATNNISALHLINHFLHLPPICAFHTRMIDGSIK
jgi:hypothetical protein